MIWVLARAVVCTDHESGGIPCLAHATDNNENLIKFESKMEAELYVYINLDDDPDVLIIPEMEVINPWIGDLNVPDRINWRRV